VGAGCPERREAQNQPEQNLGKTYSSTNSPDWIGGYAKIYGFSIRHDVTLFAWLSLKIQARRMLMEIKFSTKENNPQKMT